MPFEHVILDKYEIVNEGESKIYELASYQQEGRNDTPAKYKLIFVDYKVEFKNGVISIQSNITEIFNPIHKIGLGFTTENISEIDETASERKYYFIENTLCFISDDINKLKSWRITFNDSINNIIISNKHTVFLDMKFYAVTNDSKIEIKDGIETSGDVESQPLVKSPIDAERTWLIDLLKLIHNRQDITSNITTGICKKC